MRLLQQVLGLLYLIPCLLGSRFVVSLIHLCLQHFEKPFEAAKAEKLDILAQRTSTREDVEVIGVVICLEENVVASETQHLVAAATLGEVEAHGALSVRPVRSSDEESESGSKGTLNVHGGVEIGDGAKKRWAD